MPVDTEPPRPTAPAAEAPPAAPDADAAPPLLSVCIPAYNRAAQLPELLDSIAAQDFADYEVVVCEDRSPERPAIRAVVERYQAVLPGRLRYFENAGNLGYDANFRELVRRARGEFCFIMGNDDVVAPGAFATVADALRRSPEAGVVLRSFAYFRTRPDEFYTIARYFPDELRLPPGPDTIVQFYRRCGIMSGLVIRRRDALALETDRFDGTLFYQLHLIANILLRRPGVIVPEVLAYYRVGGTPEFGTSAAERGRHTPGGSYDPDEGVRFLDGILGIARDFDAEHGTRVYPRLRADAARHAYHTFVHYGGQPLGEYLRLYRGLAGLGFWRYPLFHVSGAAVAVVGAPRLRRLVHAVRRRLGYTPSLGERPRGAVVLRSPRLGARPHLAPNERPAGRA
jgi:glycosyltransferase involved in cell wall biosynthesis